MAHSAPDSAGTLHDLMARSAWLADPPSQALWELIFKEFGLWSKPHVLLKGALRARLPPTLSFPQPVQTPVSGSARGHVCPLPWVRAVVFLYDE